MPIPSTADAPVWTPESWRHRRALQQPDYPDTAALERVLAELRTLPPLVTSWEILDLRRQLAEAATGKRFVLQAGDCAEQFATCTPNRITNMLKVLFQEWFPQIMYNHHQTGPDGAVTDDTSFEKIDGSAERGSLSSAAWSA